MDRIVMTDFGSIAISANAIKEAKALWPNKRVAPFSKACPCCGTPDAITDPRIVEEWDEELTGRACAFAKALYTAGYDVVGLEITSLAVFGIKG